MTLRQYLTRLIALAAGPLAALALALALLQVRELRSDQELAAQNIVAQAAQVVDAAFAARIAALQTLGAAPPLAPGLRSAQLYAQAKAFEGAFGSPVTLLGPGPVLLWHTRAPPGTPPLIYPFDPEATGESGARRRAVPTAFAQGVPAVGDLTSLAPFVGEAAAGVAVPVPPAPQEAGSTAAIAPVAFVLATTIGARQLEAFLHSVLLPEGWTLALHDSTGRVVARHGAVPDTGPAADDEPAAVHVAALAQAPWRVVLEISRTAYGAPLREAASLWILAVVAATALGLLLGQVASRRLGDAVHSLTLSAPPAHTAAIPADRAEIEEIAAVRRRLDQVVAARDRAEAEQRRSEREMRERLQRLIAVRDDVQEDERRRIARELHDELQQTLAAIQMEAAAGASLAASRPQAVPAALQRIHDLAAGTIDATRRIVNDLRPQLLEELGLVPALEVLAERFAQRTGVRCTVHASGPLAADHGLPAAMATCLYRVAQESLNNVARHADASAVRITLDDHIAEAAAAGTRELRLAIEDNGRGLAEGDRRKSDAYGLLGMEERVHALGGELSLLPSAGGGLTVQVTVPGVRAVAAQDESLPR